MEFVIKLAGYSEYGYRYEKTYRREKYALAKIKEIADPIGYQNFLEAFEKYKKQPEKYEGKYFDYYLSNFYLKNESKYKNCSLLIDIYY